MLLLLLLLTISYISERELDNCSCDQLIDMRSNLLGPSVLPLILLKWLTCSRRAKWLSSGTSLVVVQNVGLLCEMSTSPNRNVDVLLTEKESCAATGAESGRDGDTVAKKETKGSVVIAMRHIAIFSGCPSIMATPNFGDLVKQILRGCHNSC